MEIDQLNFNNIQPIELNNLAKKVAEAIAKKDRVKTHQLRNVFSAIEKIRTNYKKGGISEALEMQLVMLKPTIAYAAGRQKSIRYNFFPLVDKAVDAVLAEKGDTENQKKAYERFFQLMESVVAYHKFFEK